MTEQEKLHDSAEYKKMRSQQLYCFEAPELMGSIIRANEICAKLSTMTFNSPEYRKIIEELIPGLPKTSAIVPPFHCDHGHGVIIGEEMDEMLAHPFFWCKGYVASSQYVVYSRVFLGSRQLYFESR